MTNTPETAVKQLEQAQFKREHALLLKRILAVESANDLTEVNNRIRAFEDASARQKSAADANVTFMKRLAALEQAYPKLKAKDDDLSGSINAVDERMKRMEHQAVLWQRNVDSNSPMDELRAEFEKILSRSEAKHAQSIKNLADQILSLKETMRLGQETFRLLQPSLQLSDTVHPSSEGVQESSVPGSRILNDVDPAPETQPAETQPRNQQNTRSHKKRIRAEPQDADGTTNVPAKRRKRNNAATSTSEVEPNSDSGLTDTIPARHNPREASKTNTNTGAPAGSSDMGPPPKALPHRKDSNRRYTRKERARRNMSEVPDVWDKEPSRKLHQTQPVISQASKDQLTNNDIVVSSSHKGSRKAANCDPRPVSKSKAATEVETPYNLKGKNLADTIAEMEGILDARARENENISDYQPTSEVPDIASPGPRPARAQAQKSSARTATVLIGTLLAPRIQQPSNSTPQLNPPSGPTTRRKAILLDPKMEQEAAALFPHLRKI